ncbi:hypothetical protein BCT42_22920 [Vibrio lentus]|nr:hypothetical protein BCU45_01215 [Vibrio lentus]PMJ52759.1 hypothetical protein BCU20_04915 [Vibrio lentus]PMN00383.1 hypothetical protein BCT42_22920 [Vibrio lentus]
MPVRGDSMTPTLKKQALIMVNHIKDFAGDGIYVFRFDAVNGEASAIYEIRLKRSQRQHNLRTVGTNKK